jgi:hypothetical protein
VAALLALLSAVWFALSAALQQRGQFTLARSGTPVEGVTGLFRLLAVPVWLFEERLTRPGWHVAVAFAALLAALAGAVLITLANRETAMPGAEGSAAETPHADPSPA